MSRSQHLFVRIDALRTELNSLPPMSDEQRQKLDKKMRLEFHYNTNHIEGNTLTYGETELLFLHDEVRGSHTTREIDEMKASEVALRMIEDLTKDEEHPLTESFIKELNRILLKEPFWKEAMTPDGQETRRLIDIGEYKKYPNNVRTQSGELFHYASPQETPIKMGELMDWYRNELEEGSLHPVALAAALHYRFVRIHPFDDGNGRLSRLLMNYVLLRAGYPAVVIKSADKKGYLNALHDADAGNLESFVDYIAKQEEWSLELALKAARGEELEEMDDWKKELALLKRKLGNEEEIAEQKSPEVLNKFLQTIVKPFQTGFEKDLLQFNELFQRITTDATGTMKRFDNRHELWDLRTATVNRYLDTFQYSYGLVGFKKKKDEVFDLHLLLRWDLGDYKYTLTFPVFHASASNKIKTITHFYHQDLTPSEKAEVIAESGKWILEEIKKHL